MSSTLETFIKNFLSIDEKIEGPILFSKKAVISSNGDPSAAIIKEPLIMSINNVYCINTNKRIIFASSGIQYDVSAKKVDGKTGLALGIWSEEKGAEISTKISHGYVFYSILKEKVYNIRFASRFVSETTFPVAQAIPQVLATIMFILGVLMLIIGFMSSLLLVLFGVVCIIAGAILFTVRSLKTPQAIGVALKQQNTMIIVLRNVIPERKIVETGEKKSETIHSKYSYLYLHIEFSEAVTAAEMSELAQVLMK